MCNVGHYAFTRHELRKTRGTARGNLYLRQTRSPSPSCPLATTYSLAAPTWTSSFVVPMVLMSRLTQSIHLFFGLHRFRLPGGTISRVFLPTYSWSRLLKCPNHLSLAFLHLSVMFSTLSLSLISSLLTWSLSVWPHAHLHIFISVTSSLFTWEQSLVLSPFRTA